MNNNLPDDTPIESGVLDRLIASSQERIEGYNFDIRKNVLEYDDVMAKQRETIYDERRRTLTGDLNLDERIDAAFEIIIDELVANYLDDYPGFVQEEVNRAVVDFSNQETGEVYARGVLSRLRALLPVHRLDLDELEGISADDISTELMSLAYENLEEGRNIYQLLQAMGRFIPLLPPIPNLGAILAARKTGQLQVRGALQKQFLQQVRDVFDNFLASYIEENEKETIWQAAESEIEASFQRFPVERVSQDALREQQLVFQRRVARAMRELLLESLSALDSDALVEALQNYIAQEREKWKVRIGEEQFTNFQRTLILTAIDREWRDYLTAADDLRREIGLESAGRQRDPKVEYKKRSYEMFADMRNNIQKNIASDYFKSIARHEEYLRQQQLQVSYQEQLMNSGYQVVNRAGGKGGEVRRDAPKIGRNDPCYCGSGKKYKNCHLKIDQRKNAGAVSGETRRTAKRKPKRKR